MTLSTNNTTQWKRNITILAFFTTLILGITAAVGFFNSSIYAPFAPPKYVQESRAQDLITFILGIPFLITSLLGIYREKAWAVPLWTGVLAYELYVYAIYTFGAVYTIMFPGYLAAASLSLYSIIFLLSKTRTLYIQETLGKRLPRRWIAVFFALITLIFAVIWLGSVISSIKSGQPDSGHLIFVIDLVIVLPAFAITAFKLWQKDPMGDLLSGLMLIKFDSLCIAIILGQVFRKTAQLSVETDLLGIFIPLGLLGLVLTVIYFSNFKK